MAASLRNQHHWIFCVAALAVWLALGWPFLQELVTGAGLRRHPVPASWLVPFTIFGAAVLGSIVLRPRGRPHWALLWVQVAAVLGMAIVLPSDVMSVFLIIIAWQVAMATTSGKALAWVAFQTLVILAALSQVPRPDVSAILGLSLVLQLSFVLTAHALRREAQAARALVQANGELRSAQAVIANTARSAERLRISRELHDAWGHELTALGLQLEIASHVSAAGQANDHVLHAKRLARALLGKVRDVVAVLRKAERCAPQDGLESLAQGAPVPAVQVPGSSRASASSAEAQASISRAQQAVAEAATRAGASSPWLQASSTGEGMPLAESAGARAGPRSERGGAPTLADGAGNKRHWFFCVAALAVWVAVGSPVFQAFAAGAKIRDLPVSALWFVPFMVFGVAVFCAMTLRLGRRLQWTLLSVQLAAVAAMAIIVPWAAMTQFLIIIAWQVALATAPGKALAWVAFQTLVIIGALGLAPVPDFCWVIGKSFAIQLFIVFAAQALRREAETARELAQKNLELRAAQAIIANTVRDAERLRISRELEDAWREELAALGLQLDTASQAMESGRALDHVMQAKGLADALLGKVRDVVATLREAELSDLKDTLEALAHSIPAPAVHVEIAPAVRVSPDQAHALMRCAQEAVTNAIKHAEASNLWLQVTADGGGVRLIARNDGSARPAESLPGSGLLGMRERIEALGGRLAVGAGLDFGFTVDAWLPSSAPQTA